MDIDVSDYEKENEAMNLTHLFLMMFELTSFSKANRLMKLKTWIYNSYIWGRIRLQR